MKIPGNFPIYSNPIATLRSWSTRLLALRNFAVSNDFSTFFDWTPAVIPRPIMAFNTLKIFYAKYCVVGDGKVVFLKLKFTITITAAGDNTLYVSLPVLTTFPAEQMVGCETRGASTLVTNLTASVGVAGSGGIGTDSHMTIHDDTVGLAGTVTFLVDAWYLAK